MTQDRILYDGQESVGEKTEWFEVLAADVATTADRTSGLQRCTKSFGILFQIVIGALSNTPTYTPSILVPGGDTTIADATIITGSAVSSSGVSFLAIYPGGVAALGDENLDATLPREWKLKLAYSGADTTHNADTHVYARYI